MSENKEKLNSVILGGLLHDIGKLIQRADGFNKNHSVTGEDFIQSCASENLTKKVILNCIKYHHEKLLKNANLEINNICYIIYEADNLAAATDRRKDLDKEEVEYKGKFDNYDKETVLHSVFNTLHNKIKGKTENGYYLRDLNESNNISYPVNLKQENIKAINADYKKLKETLNQNLKSSKLSNNSVLQILESLTSYIPSSTDTSELVDISLYDHLKLTAAIASCMYIYFEAKEETDYKKVCFDNPNKQEPYFLLVSGDLSGIQNFIYTISSKGALKSLRARSFYLEILLEHIVNELLEQFDLSRANLLYTGGGHFYMLLPNTEEVKNKLKEAKETINQWFIENFDINLYLAFGHAEMTSEELNKNISKKYKEVAEEVSKDKLSRYNPEQLKEMLKPQNNHASGHECVICKTSKVETRERKKEDKVIFTHSCDLCYNLFESGKTLLNDNLLIVVKEEKENNRNPLPLPSVTGDKFLYFIEGVDFSNIGIKKYLRVYRKNKWTSVDNVATRLWTGDYNKKSSEKDEDKLIDFEELANNSTGIKRLAVMRADVDSLGSAFTGGFKIDASKNLTGKEKGEFENKYATLSRTTTLSRQLSLFFKHYINNICDGNLKGEGDELPEKGVFHLSTKEKKKTQNDNGKKNLVIVYSGGDDVFVVGAWDEVIDFAVNLRRAFRKFTCKKLTFSAGIGFFSPTFPISQMAELTGKLEESAKKNNDDKDDKKDSVALFGIDKSIMRNGESSTRKDVYTWKEFEENIYEEKIKKLQYICYFDEEESDENKLYFSTSLMYKLKLLLEDEEKSSINLARLAYTIARLQPVDKASDKKKENYEKFKKLIYGSAQSPESRKQLITAIDLLIYLHRDTNNKEDKHE